MSYSIEAKRFRHFQSACHQITTDKTALIEQVFTKSLPIKLLKDQGIHFRRRIYTPLVTLWAFMNQVLNSDHSCRCAVGSVIALQSALQEKIVSSATGGYCRARGRLPLSLIVEWMKGTARELQERCRKECKWKGLEVVLVDGTTINVCDTRANVKFFSKPTRGQGLLCGRMVGVFSLSTGCLMDYLLGAFSGKGSGEISLFRELIGGLKKGQVLLMDRLYSDYFTLGLLARKQVDFIVRRKDKSTSLCKRRRLGKGDELMVMKRPWVKNTAVCFALVGLVAELMNVRVIKVQIKRRGYRTKSLLLLTSLLDPKKYPPQEIAELYATRWCVETDYRSLKAGLGLDILRCQSPEMVKKEVATYLLVYNMVRTILFEAALSKGCHPRDLSFQETVQLLTQFRSLMSLALPRQKQSMYKHLLASIKDRVRNRPGRTEPRLVKYQRIKYGQLKKPRQLARNDFTKKGWAYEQRKKQQKCSA